MTAIDRYRFRISEDAAAWLLRLQADSSSPTRAAFVAWCRQSPVHVEEFLLISATWQQLDNLPSDEVIATLVAEAQNEHSNVTVLGVSTTKASVESLPKLTQPRPHRRRLMWLAACALIAMVSSVAYRVIVPSDTFTYATATGDQLVVKLVDGSVLNLNTHSKAQVHFTEHERTIRLLQGEALFTVAHDATRPFRVSTDTTVVEAIGTQFNVYRTQEGTRVTVVEGTVRVEPRSGGGPAIKLTAGQEAKGAAKQIQPVVEPSVERAIAWRQRRLIFQSETLEHVTNEFNRYGSQRRIRIDDVNLRDRLISGVFDADDPQPLLELLAADPKLSVTTNDDEIVIRSVE